MYSNEENFKKFKFYLNFYYYFFVFQCHLNPVQLKVDRTDTSERHQSPLSKFHYRFSVKQVLSP